jgi:hypothetical protein
LRFSSDLPTVKLQLTLEILGAQKQFPIFYIFDEHNELFRAPKGGKSPIDKHPEFLRPFASFLGATKGVSHVPLIVHSI